MLKGLAGAVGDTGIVPYVPQLSHTNDIKICITAATLPGTLSALGLVDQVSVCCDWVREQVWSAASVSVWWQGVKMLKQICS